MNECTCYQAGLELEQQLLFNCVFFLLLMMRADLFQQNYYTHDS
jgi:hypothetical protein